MASRASHIVGMSADACRTKRNVSGQTSNDSIYSEAYHLDAPLAASITCSLCGVLRRCTNIHVR